MTEFMVTFLTQGHMLAIKLPPLAQIHHPLIT